MSDAFETTMKNEAYKLKVYTDGDCPLCKWMRSRVEPRDRYQRIVWMNYRDTAVWETAAPFTFEELDTEMHTRRDDGTWRAGYGAWIEVLRVLPRWWVVTPVISLWPITAFGKIFYKWLASRRFALFGVPPPCGPDGVCSLHAHRK
jgi:predicted DCC family thiol-disulfide oxidoreductase YuxK